MRLIPQWEPESIDRHDSAHPQVYQRSKRHILAGAGVNGLRRRAGGARLCATGRSSIIPQWLLEGWLYNGGGTGARTLLGTVAASTIGVAGTVFSITIAALSLAAGQMGPRLLRNFTRDRGVQFTLGAFLGTFSYALRSGSRSLHPPIFGAVPLPSLIKGGVICNSSTLKV
jgi:hypothetical protein